MAQTVICSTSFFNENGVKFTIDSSLRCGTRCYAESKILSVEYPPNVIAPRNR